MKTKLSIINALISLLIALGFSIPALRLNNSVTT